MSDYTILIYQEPLTDFECEQIIGLCYDAKLEKIDDQKSRPIRNSHSRIFDDFETHSCYRLHSQRGLESIQLIGKEPLYVGLFNNDIEACLIEIANLWMEILDKDFSMNDLSDHLPFIVIIYEEVFQKQLIIDKELFYQLEAQYRSVIEEIEGELDILFEKNRFRYQ